MSSIWHSCSQKVHIHSPGFSQSFRILIFSTEISTSHISLNKSDFDKFILLCFFSGFVWGAIIPAWGSQSLLLPLRIVLLQRTNPGNTSSWTGKGGAGDWNRPLLWCTEIIWMIFITWLVYLGRGGALIFPKPSAHFSSTYSWLGTEFVILRNTRNIMFLPSSTSSSLLVQRNILDTLSVPGGAALEQEVEHEISY